MEIWDIYDKQRNRTNRQLRRGDAFESGDYHLVVHVCLFNEKGEMLIQKRQSDRDHWPNMWDLTVGGSAIAGEDPQQAAEREVKEELGYELNLANQRPSLTINFENGFDDIFIVRTEVELPSLPIPSEEVQEVKWASKDVILSKIEEGLFLPYYHSLIHLLFDMKDQRGAHRK
ncbi:NUDIX hydrolase [Aquisalibacillus elongatus]|uniref:NUDIX domain-containing protein n=1 Tax=Aquisalibacillus elongatus TaxID=485577 RepID=A0A3N5C356_9BACI|nr:NUDIX domain-containing protein [Aquisalibacillus elongatus]RPF50661.1 NUDIX domain-containing protein [Aquisalibacillus elongatus]